MTDIILDGNEINSLDDLRKLLEGYFVLPDTYAGTLDSLCECLMNLEEQISVNLTHPQHLDNALYDGVRRCMFRVSMGNPNITFRVLYT